MAVLVAVGTLGLFGDGSTTIVDTVAEVVGG